MRKFKRREIALVDGGRLVLDSNGSIRHLAADGSMTESWAVTDAEWPSHALRFGLRPESQTVAPHGNRIEGTKPAR